ncbi:MAG: response regulator [Candidatus Aureabacteria bacterium]|nr:response regulator [Candidatus Auribacterota bacterium]
MSKKKTVLVIDDDESLRKMLQMRFSFSDYKVVTAESGEKAFDVINKCKPELILLDIAMPDMDGYEVCKILKDNPETRDIPIVFLTAIGGNIENKLQSLMVGGVDYIQKPFDGSDLLKRIEKILDGG